MDKVLEGLLDPLSPYTSACDAAVGLQNKFEELVLADKKLYAMACKAYTSWVRFYSSYPHEMREVFNRKELHLGHYAKSFALRDPPQKIGGTGKLIREREDAQRSRPRHQNRLSNQRPDGVPVKRPEAKRLQNFGSGILKNVRMLNTSEYDSGLQPRKKPKKS
ncbi:PREDICTED: probable ATP-dependent RNA helicase CG8611 [Ceratosolen solmsi marchali]|uniref:Probable ATP-dependent RNA helicase CG8611 n=1 Tax=Ceratosolen solmsi marchali TaxID=326594 RepID=A0AAJ7E2W9_9HYME|nr:PREDICTED: probable ATP-dependent RNA helicase CG8611 [Ceratosolen solmsi marchali]